MLLQHSMLEDGFDSCVGEALAACITLLDWVVGLVAFDWLSLDGVGIKVMECEDTAVAF